MNPSTADTRPSTIQRLERVANERDALKREVRALAARCQQLDTELAAARARHEIDEMAGVEQRALKPLRED
jgi:hypothetical protein